MDGASLRLQRIKEIIEYIHDKQPYTQDVQNMALLTYGMKAKTTSLLLDEIKKTGIVKFDREGRWRPASDKLYRIYLGKGKEIGDTGDRDKTTERDDKSDDKSYLQ